MRSRFRTRPRLESLEARLQLSAVGPAPAAASGPGLAPAASGGATLLPQGYDGFSLGINIDPIDYYTTNLIFNNVMEYSPDHWAPSGDGVNPNWDVPGLQMPQFDSNGYPIGMGNLASLGYMLNTAPLLHNGDVFPSGDYTLTFDGSGTVQVGVGSEAVSFSQAGGAGQPHTVYITPNDFGIPVDIVQSDPSDYVRNIRLIMPGYQGTYATDPFTHEIEQALQPFDIIRFMDTMNTNNSTVTDWSDETPGTYFTQATDSGVSVQYLVELANDVHADPWFCMPVMADANYVQQFATYVKDNLAPGLKAYVEYGNEDWNGQFAQFQYVDQYAQANGLSMPQGVADLATKDWNIWRQVFGADDDRVVRVAAAQQGWPGYTLDGMLERLVSTASPSDPDDGFDVVSGAPYFAADTSGYGPQTTTEDIIDDNIAAIPSQSSIYLTPWEDDVQRWEGILGRPIEDISYEGGFGVSPNGDTTVPWYQAYVGTQTDPGMYTWTMDYLENLRASGSDGINWYSLASGIGQWGAWGAMDYLGQPAAQAPKYQALVDFSKTILPDVNGVAVSASTATGFTVSWSSKQHASSTVWVGTSPGRETLSYADSILDTIHQTAVTGLRPNTVYYYYIEEVDKDGNLVRSAEYQTTTAKAQLPVVPAGQGFSLSLADLRPGTVVGTVQASDPDGLALRYSIVGGNGGLLSSDFAINSSTGVITVVNPLAEIQALLAGSITPKVQVSVAWEPDRAVTVPVVIRGGLFASSPAHPASTPSAPPSVASAPPSVASAPPSVASAPPSVASAPPSLPAVAVPSQADTPAPGFIPDAEQASTGTPGAPLPTTQAPTPAAVPTLLGAPVVAGPIPLAGLLARFASGGDPGDGTGVRSHRSGKRVLDRMALPKSLIHPTSVEARGPLPRIARGVPVKSLIHPTSVEARGPLPRIARGVLGRAGVGRVPRAASGRAKGAS